MIFCLLLRSMNEFPSQGFFNWSLGPATTQVKVTRYPIRNKDLNITFKKNLKLQCCKELQNLLQDSFANWFSENLVSRNIGITDFKIYDNYQVSYSDLVRHSIFQSHHGYDQPFRRFASLWFHSPPFYRLWTIETNSWLCCSQ